MSNGLTMANPDKIKVKASAVKKYFLYGAVYERIRRIRVKLNLFFFSLTVDGIRIFNFA